MYTAFYGLREKPFTLSPDPRYLFLSDTHREVLGHLIYGIEENEGFIAISGEVGTGKTTLCRTLLDRLGRDAEVAFLFNPHLAPADLLHEIHAEFDLPGKGNSLPELTRNLYAFLLEKKRKGRRVLLIIDEAQTLPIETLEQVRLLSNLETSREKLLQIVLLGQPELDEKLSIPELRQLRQRIGVWWHLGPLTPRETHDYVLHRLRIAGADGNLFDETALSLIHDLSQGVPRIINLLCDRALLAGYAAGSRKLDRKLLLGVAAEIDSARQALPEPRRPRARLALALGSGLLLLVGGTLLQPGGIAVLEGPILPEISAPEPEDSTSVVSLAPREPEAHAGIEAPPARIAPPAARASNAPGRAAVSGTEILDALLPTRSQAAVITAASNAALDAWNLPLSDASLPGLADALTVLRKQGLRALSVESADLSMLEELDLPVLVELRAAQGAQRWVLLRAIVGNQVDLQGLLREETVRVGALDFVARWTGRAFVPWRDFESLPQVLEPWQQGTAVRWLQASILEL
ncbi:MAG: AAA family ATPase [Myxococcota bacterium]